MRSSWGTEVMVVGAGPTGMLLAGELARRDVRVRLLEKRTEPAEHSRALGVMPRTMEMLETLGLVDEFLTHGHRVHGGKIYGRKQRLLATMDFRDLPTRYPFMLLLPQTRTEAILRHNLEELGVGIEWGTELKAFHAEKTGMGLELALSTGVKEDFCGYLVGCDGAHSTVRKGVGLEFVGASYQQNWLLADVTLEPRLDPKFMHLFACPTGPIIFFPLPENAWRIVAMRPGSTADAAQANLENILELLEKKPTRSPSPASSSVGGGFFHSPSSDRSLTKRKGFSLWGCRPYPQSGGRTGHEYWIWRCHEPGLEVGVRGEGIGNGDPSR